MLHPTDIAAIADGVVVPSPTVEYDGKAFYYYLYRTHSPVTGEYYIGLAQIAVRRTDRWSKLCHLSGGASHRYQGSGTWVNNQPAGSLVTVITSYHPTMEALNIAERAAIAAVRGIDPLNRNRAPGGEGNNTYKSRIESQQRRRAKERQQMALALAA
jgi:hypothetical protein